MCNGASATEKRRWNMPLTQSSAATTNRKARAVDKLTTEERAQLEPFLHWVACPHCNGTAVNLTGGDFCPVCQRSGRVLASTANILRTALIFADMDGSKRAAMVAKVQALEAELAGVRSHISEQIAHVETRIQDGDEMGARVWRIALEDVAREGRAILHRGEVEGAPEDE